MDLPDLMGFFSTSCFGFCTWRSQQLLSGVNINLITFRVHFLKDKLEATSASLEQPKVFSKTHTCAFNVSLDSEETHLEF